jgi:hypothetical protein
VPTSTCPPGGCPPAASEARINCPDVQAAPVFAPSTPSSRSLALVWLHGSQSFVVRDITDINHPVTVSTPPVDPSASFVSATELASGFARMPLSGSPQTIVVRCIGQGGFISWSPDGTQAAYIYVTVDFSAAEVHVISGGLDRKVDSMTGLPWAVGCEAPDCADRVDSRLLYSPDGKYISLVQNWGGPVLRIWDSQGEIVRAVDASSLTRSQIPTMSVWSGQGLYFRDGNGVEVWRAGTQKLVLPGVAWILPKASPAGGQITYEAKDSSGLPSVYVLDTTSGSTGLIARLRSRPAFLTSRYLWYRGERPCTTGDAYPCNAGVTTIATGKTYIYDLQTANEYESVIDAVWDVWPHPA